MYRDAFVGLCVLVMLLDDGSWCCCLQDVSRCCCWWSIHRVVLVVGRCVVVLLLEDVFYFGEILYEEDACGTAVGGDIAVVHAFNSAIQRPPQGVPRFAGCLTSWAI